MELLWRTKQAINRVLAVAGHELVRLGDSPTMDAALWRLAARGVPVGGVVDVGASDGRWMRKARRRYPNARFLLIDANPVHAPALERLAARTPGVSVALVAAAARTGRVYFDDSHAFIGIAAEAPLAAHYREVPAMTVDDLVAQHGLPGPYLLKLDTHGFERPILDGAERTLAGASAVVIEAYNFRALPHTPRFTEIIARLESQGFRLVDACDPHHRPRDGALWQLDLVFQRAGSVLETADDPYWLYGMRRVPGWAKPGQPVLPRRKQVAPLQAVRATVTTRADAESSR